MRQIGFIAGLCKAALILGCGAAAADSQIEQLVTAFDAACVSPKASDSIMDASERVATARNWIRIRSEATPMPMMHNDGSPKLSWTKVWQFDVPNGRKGIVTVSSLRPDARDDRPDIKGMRYSVCVVDPQGSMGRDDLAKTIERHFGSVIEKDDRQKFRDSDTWLIRSEKRSGVCNSSISVMSSTNGPERERRAVLIYRDMFYPDRATMPPMFESTRCPI